MNAIFYLMQKTVKNSILDTLRHPLKCILYGFIILSMIYGAVMGFTAASDGSSFLDRVIEVSGGRLLSGAYMVVLYFISVPILLKGLSEGTSFFTLSDVNHMFIAPVSEKTVLMYGIGRRLASMLMLVVTFSAYGGMLVNMFHITIGETLMLIIGIVLMLIFVQFTTLMLFCLTSGHPKRAAVLRYFIYGMAFVPLLLVIVHFFRSGITAESLFESVSLPFLEWVPLIGWMHGFLYAFLTADSVRGLVYGLLLMLLGFSAMATLFLSDVDFFEDVLSSAENYHEFRESIREGKMSDKVMMGNRPVRLRRLGIGRGRGGTVIFFKHLHEGHRRSRLLFFNINTVVLLFVAFVTAIGMKLAMPNVMPTIIYLSVTTLCVYVQFFFSASGDWVKELTKPYIYLIPERAERKLLMAAATGLIKPLTDAIITFGLLSIYVGGVFCDIETSVLVYASFGSVYIAANILAQRIVGLESSGGIFITFYMSVIILALLPGIVIGLVVLSGLAGTFGAVATTLLGMPIFLWNLLISVIIFLTCRNLLNNKE